MSRLLFWGFDTEEAAEAAAGTELITRAGVAGAVLDQFLDPITLDFVDTDDGEWLETADSRTIVIIMIEMRLGKSYSSPADGTRIAAAFEDGEPVTTGFVVTEITRAMGILEAAGVLTDFSIRVTEDGTADGQVLVDETGRFTPELRWIDLATGSPVDLVYAPFGGV